MIGKAQGWHWALRKKDSLGFTEKEVFWGSFPGRGSSAIDPWTTLVRGTEHPRNRKSTHNLSPPSIYMDSQLWVKNSIVRMREKRVPNLDQHVQMSRDKRAWDILGTKVTVCVPEA